MTEQDTRYFWAKVRRGDPADCWPWQGYHTPAGYGLIKVHGRKTRTHRLAYELATGRNIPPGAIIRHLCNNPACCNPAHLAVGTHADNVADRVAAGRSARGEHNGRAKLTWDAVVAIRQQAETGASDCQLARQFAVSPRCISFIRSGSHWRMD